MQSILFSKALHTTVLKYNWISNFGYLGPYTLRVTKGFLYLTIYNNGKRKKSLSFVNKYSLQYLRRFLQVTKIEKYKIDKQFFNDRRMP